MSVTYQTTGSRKVVYRDPHGELYRGSEWLPDVGDVWEDLRFPASNLRISPVAQKPDADDETGCYLFDANTNERVTVQVQLPHSWKEGSPIVPHVHWAKTTSAAGNVAWRIQYKWCPIGEVLDSDWASITTTTTIPATLDDNTAYRHLISTFGEIDTTGKRISDMLLVRVWRMGAYGTDTYGADAALAEFDIHVLLDTNGSDLQFEKGHVG